MLFIIAAANCQDTVAVYSDYVVYKGDTLNRFNAEGIKTGGWLMLRADTITSARITDHPPSTNTSRRPIYKAIAKGQYLNGQKQGKWTFGHNDFKKYYAEVSYKDNKLLNPILFYAAHNQLWLKAEDINGKWTYYLWDKDKDTYVDTHQKYTLDFLFEMCGHDFNKIK